MTQRRHSPLLDGGSGEEDDDDEEEDDDEDENDAENRRKFGPNQGSLEKKKSFHLLGRVRWTLGLRGFVVVVVIALASAGERYQSSSMFAFSHPKKASMGGASLERSTRKTYHIICYGDSLTAGTSPPNVNDHPYAPHLQAKLKELLSSPNDKDEEIDVPEVKMSYLGLPGWTTMNILNMKDMASVGLQWLLKDVTDENASSSSSIVLVVLLAGTNDVGKNADKLPKPGDPEEEAERRQEAVASDILAPLIQMHESVQKFPTVALGIPPSGWQARTPAAASVAQSINRALQEWCEKTPGRYYVPYPIATFDGESNFWSFDTLHLSPEGYRYVGEELARPILEILEKEEETRKQGAERNKAK